MHPESRDLLAPPALAGGARISGIVGVRISGTRKSCLNMVGISFEGFPTISKAFSYVESIWKTPSGNGGKPTQHNITADAT
jgi:hypothetical protein